MSICSLYCHNILSSLSLSPSLPPSLPPSPSLSLLQSSVAIIPLVIYFSGLIATFFMKRLNEFVGRYVSVNDYYYLGFPQSMLSDLKSMLNLIAYGSMRAFKFIKKSKLDQNQFKLSTQHKYMYMCQKKL